MNRIFGLVLWGLALVSGMAGASNTVLVHLASFSCPHCAEFEPYAGQLAAEATRAGMTYSFAPIAIGESQDFAAELTYYAARELSAGAARQVRAGMFDAKHKNGLPVETVTQAVEWLLLNQQESADTWNVLQSATETEAPRKALIRAQRLAETAGISYIPAFVFIVDGRISKTVQYTVGESAQSLLVNLRKELAAPTKASSVNRP